VLTSGVGAQVLCIGALGSRNVRWVVDFGVKYATLPFAQRTEFAVEIQLSSEIQDGLDAARIEKLRKSSRLKIVADGQEYKVLRQWATGFSMEAETAPQLRGLVDLYDGSVHLCQCLIVAIDQEGREVRFEFKRATKVADKPALDFEKPADAPVGLIAVDAPH